MFCSSNFTFVCRCTWNGTEAQRGFLLRCTGERHHFKQHSHSCTTVKSAWVPQDGHWLVTPGEREGMPVLRWTNTSPFPRSHSNTSTLLIFKQTWNVISDTTKPALGEFRWPFLRDLTSSGKPRRQRSCDDIIRLSGWLCFERENC